MKIDYTKRFLKNFKRRMTTNITLDQRFTDRIKLFNSDRSDPILRDHKLTGKWKGFRAFSITGDIRVIYRIKDKDTVEFYDIGSHNQVY